MSFVISFLFKNSPIPLHLSIHEKEILQEHLDLFKRNGFGIEKIKKPEGESSSSFEGGEMKLDEEQEEQEEEQEDHFGILSCEYQITSIPQLSLITAKNSSILFGEEDVKFLIEHISERGLESHKNNHHQDKINDINSSSSFPKSPKNDEKYSLLFSLSKVHDIFASKACRSSIMVGSPLQFSTMRGVISRLGELNHPWNCPHGFSLFLSFLVRLFFTFCLCRRPTMKHLMEMNG